jgi:hypothetical protein
MYGGKFVLLLKYSFLEWNVDFEKIFHVSTSRYEPEFVLYCSTNLSLQWDSTEGEWRKKGSKAAVYALQCITKQGYRVALTLRACTPVHTPSRHGPGHLECNCRYLDPGPSMSPTSTTPYQLKFVPFLPCLAL